MVTHLGKHFDSLFALDEDPWKYQTSWLEQRRLDLLVAMLPQEFYGSIFEPACANGSLTRRLAGRSRRVVGWDGSPHAIAHARRFLALHPHVELAEKSVPDHWPEVSFDLVVLSDFLYYLPKDRIVDVALRSAQTVSPRGSIIACHWRGAAHDFLVDGGDAVHAVLVEVLGEPETSYFDERHVMDVWTR